MPSNQRNDLSIFLHLLVGCPMVSLVAVMAASLDDAIRSQKIDGMGLYLQRVLIGGLMISLVKSLETSLDVATGHRIVKKKNFQRLP